MKVTVTMKKAKLTVTVTMKDKPDKQKLVKPKLVKPKLVTPTVHDLLVKEHHKWRKEEADSWDIYNSIRARRRGSRR